MEAIKLNTLINKNELAATRILEKQDNLLLEECKVQIIEKRINLNNEEKKEIKKFILGDCNINTKRMVTFSLIYNIRHDPKIQKVTLRLLREANNSQEIEKVITLQNSYNNYYILFLYVMFLKKNERKIFLENIFPEEDGEISREKIFNIEKDINTRIKSEEKLFKKNITGYFGISYKKMSDPEFLFKSLIEKYGVNNKPVKKNLILIPKLNNFKEKSKKIYLSILFILIIPLLDFFNKKESRNFKEISFKNF